MASVDETISVQEKPADNANAGIVHRLGGMAGNAEGRFKALLKIMPSVRASDSNGTAKAKKTNAKNSDDNYIELKDRMLAWWNGTEGSPQKRTKKQTITTSAKTLPDANEWTSERFRVVQKIWGEGYMEPGGAAFARKLLGPAKVDSKKTVLDISAKLGGTAALIAKDASLYMEAWECHPGLAIKTVGYINSLGLGQRVPLETVDYNTVELAARKYDVIYSRERLFAIENKKNLIEKIGPALKPKGQFLFTDLMAFDPDNHEKEIIAWGAAERVEIYPWTEELYKAVLENSGFEIWATHDFSREYLKLIHSAWHKVMRDIETGDFDRKFVDYLMQEGKIWQARARALETGALQVKRIHATSPQATD